MSPDCNWKGKKISYFHFKIRTIRGYYNYGKLTLPILNVFKISFMVEKNMGRRGMLKNFSQFLWSNKLSKAVQPYQIFLFLSCKETLQLLLIYWFTLQRLWHMLPCWVCLVYIVVLPECYKMAFSKRCHMWILVTKQLFYLSFLDNHTHWPDSF